jgi:hypothetical protein
MHVPISCFAKHKRGSSGVEKMFLIQGGKRWERKINICQTGKNKKHHNPMSISI